MGEFLIFCLFQSSVEAALSKEGRQQRAVGADELKKFVYISRKFFYLFRKWRN